MNHDRDDSSGNPSLPWTCAVRDPAHDAQLLRELAIINARTVASLGALPVGGLPAMPRRKPQLPMPLPFGASSMHEDDPMRLQQIAVAALLPLGMSGCSHTIDAGSATAHLNPHPVKRYEVIATSRAPGPWDSIQAYIHYDVVNKKCVPQDWFTSAQNVPNTGIYTGMTRIGENTWKGYFYRDALQDEDYFKLGVCHWDATSVGISADAQGVRFGWGDLLDSLLHEGVWTRYFKKSAYRNQAFVRYGTLDLDPADPVIHQHPSDYFQVTIAVKEATP
jgi:hypothetical protein